MHKKIHRVMGFAALILLNFQQAQAAPAATLQEKVAGLKKALQDNQSKLKQYEWIETVIVSKNGDEKNRKQYRCYYGADGGIQKVLIDSSQEQGRTPRGIRGRIVAHKKEEMADYMQQASDLIKRYIPPRASQIEASKVSIKPNASDKSLAFVIQDYLLPGDSLTVDLDMGKAQVTGLQVASYLDNPKDTVTLQVSFGNLQDGTSYPKLTVLTAKKKNISVQVESSGYRKVGA